MKGIETATPFDTPRLMTELVTWFAEATEERRLHPLLVIAIFTVVFLSIPAGKMAGLARSSQVMGACLVRKSSDLPEVPVMLAAGSEAQIRAYALADNELALNAGWDDARLALEIADLQEIGFDLFLSGFSDDEN
jgi:hypothetical protein